MTEQTRHTVDTITSDELDALQDERDRLRAEVDRLHRQHDAHDSLQYAFGGLADQRLAVAARLAADERSRAYTAEQRAERAEAALERVRAIADDCASPKHRGAVGIPHSVIADVLRAALDEHQEQ